MERGEHALLRRVWARRRRWRLDTLIVVALVGVALSQFAPAIAVGVNPFHRDEARWIYKARLLGEWSQFGSERWTDEGYPTVDGSFEEAFRMRDQPPVAAYLLGLGLLVQGHELTTNGYWNYERSHEWNVAQGNMPAVEVLRAARRVSVAIGVLTVVAIYALGRRLTGRAGGFAAALAFAFHPLAIETESRAWADPLLVLLIVLAALVAAALGRRAEWRWAVLLGVLLGLGGATKLAPLAVALGIGLGGGLLVVLRWTMGSGLRAGLAWKLVAVPLVAATVFVAVYPYLWRDPVGNTYNIFDYRTEAFSWQGDDWEWGVIETRTDAMRRIGQRLGQAGSVSGRTIRALEDVGISIPATWRISEVDLLVAIIGLLIGAVVIPRSGLLGGDGLAMGVVLAHVVIIAGTIGVDFPRYYLPVLLLSVLGIAYSVEYGAVVVARMAIKAWVAKSSVRARSGGRFVDRLETRPR